jgi:hypothetical protein
VEAHPGAVDVHPVVVEGHQSYGAHLGSVEP